jgi:hypothetical protein
MLPDRSSANGNLRTWLNSVFAGFSSKMINGKKIMAEGQ